MPLGQERSENSVIQGDSAELYAYSFNTDESPSDPATIDGVQFTIRRPDDTQEVLTGTIQEDGGAFLRYLNTDTLGVYRWVAQFTFTSGERRSFTDDFYVYDPFVVEPETRRSKIADDVWMRLEECFDSAEGGPWLRDMTLSYFDKSKVEKFVDEGLLLINSWPPLTNVGLDYFTTDQPDPDPAANGANEPDPDRIIIVEATLLSVIRHLMRGYVEQPNPSGANVVWQDRRDYLQRWQTIYQIESEWFKEILALWKRNFLAYGRGSLLVHSKAGRLYGPGYQRSWSVGRGWY